MRLIAEQLTRRRDSVFGLERRVADPGEQCLRQLGTGLDIRQELVELCERNAKKAGVAGRCRFRQEDALKMTDVSPYSVVFLYLGEDLTERLTPLLRKTLKPGSRVVSNTFKLAGWEPDEVKVVKCKNNYNEDQEFTLYLWRVK